MQLHEIRVRLRFMSVDGLLTYYFVALLCSGETWRVDSRYQIDDGDLDLERDFDETTYATAVRQFRYEVQRITDRGFVEEHRAMTPIGDTPPPPFIPITAFGKGSALVL